MFVIANREDVSSSNLNISVPVLPPDNYTVIVYDLGSDHLPVLSDENNSYVLAAEKENVIITDQAEAMHIWFQTLTPYLCVRLC